jgi:squalene-associated FAD-dependent desaturase
VDLVSAGHRVTLIEQKPHAGGRAYSFVDRATGESIDNGQHVLIEAYSETFRFLRQLGSDHLLFRQQPPALKFHHPVRGLCTFSVPALPRPLNLLAAVLTTNLLGFPDRLRMLRAAIAIRTSGSAQESLRHLTVDRWLKDHGQTFELIRSFWEPLVIAIMNEKPVNASALLFVNAMRRAFIESEGGSGLVIPRLGLSDVFVNPALNYIEANGGTMHFSRRIVSIDHDNDGVLTVIDAGGHREEAGAVIVAIPPWSFPDDLSKALEIHSLPTSPIISVHVWYEGTVMSDEVQGIVGKTVQWIFNRRQIVESSARDAHLSCVVSAAEDLVDLSNDELERLVLKDLAEIFGKKAESPTKMLVIRERRATFSPRPDIEHIRPPTSTKNPSIFLAGDWTNTGLPGTIEGAIQSGFAAASLIKARKLHF